ncbi:GIY-YIG nuclease family protein [Lactococcus fujiensis]|uniref:GIY-YIG nuclease family protein n=1 Tax=Lactococcus fujiensis TaxID=610251 RepID=UPI000BDE62AB|nr:GIY-YIG nuclease family protein [Lactococcus fujiensis]
MKKKSYYTYVVRCSDNTLYCGYTDNVEKRVAKHNSGNGAKYTKTRRPVQLVAQVQFADKSNATKCEWWFKHKLIRKEKLQLIESNGIKSAYEAYQMARQKS